eukprot:TRINITY_DN2871_c0_g1_i1.p1 TRINITY_DN2871_c0_g1~~TRINITY_DN2871_c0_g1_i1.p1  ORF type:complete len:104 (+),score=24.09 TRINITY_DN2871_c0_g1_i1:435-746(+)
MRQSSHLQKKTLFVVSRVELEPGAVAFEGCSRMATTSAKCGGLLNSCCILRSKTMCLLSLRSVSLCPCMGAVEKALPASAFAKAQKLEALSSSCQESLGTQLE